MKKLLLIEDDEIFANVYRNKLVLDGFQVEIAPDGETGLELMSSFAPDAVILDLILPKISGIEVIKKVREQAAFKQLPLIVFTNTYLTTMVQEAWKAGATRCLAKANCGPSEVVGTIRSILSGDAEEKRSAASEKPRKPGSRPAPAKPKPAKSEADEQFEAELRKTFNESWPATLAGIRAQLHTMTRAEGEARLPQIHTLYRRVHSLTGSAGIIGLSHLAQMADALEALLKELHDKPKNITSSTLRTVASAVDFLNVLFEQSKSPAAAGPPVKVLVVEDEEISRRAVLYALEKANLKSVSLEDPLQALEVVLINRFDLIILDVGLPNMNGFELCSKLRMLPPYKKTPVVFITSLNDFESRANSTMSGGNDFIAKPFLFVELSVKALIYALRGRLQPVTK